MRLLDRTATPVFQALLLCTVICTSACKGKDEAVTDTECAPGTTASETPGEPCVATIASVDQPDSDESIDAGVDTADVAIEKTGATATPTPSPAPVIPNPPAALTSLQGSYGADPGSVRLAMMLPTEHSLYATLHFYRLAGTTAPAASVCTAASAAGTPDVAVGAFPTDLQYAVDATGGARSSIWSYRACLYDTLDRLVTNDTTMVVTGIVSGNPGPGCGKPPCDPLQSSVVTTTFAAPNSTNGMSYHSYGAAVGDFNEDGHADFVIANDGEASKVFLNATPFDGATFSVSNLNAADLQAQDIAVGDLNGDGHLDMVVATSGGITNKVFLGNGSGTSWTMSSLDAGDTERAFAIALGDLDGDGDLDVVVGRSGNGMNANRYDYAYLNNGSGAFGSAIVTNSRDSYTYEVQLVDVDKNGTLDFIDYSGGEEVYVNLNDGTGTGWSESNALDIGTQYALSGQVVDFDGDGNLDVIVGAGIFGGEIFALFGTGITTFGPPVSLGGGFANVYGLEVADMNGDNHLDIVAAVHGMANQLVLGNGTQTPHAIAAIGSNTDDSEAVGIADFNGDGKLDAVFPNESGGSQQTRLYLGQ